MLCKNLISFPVTVYRHLGDKRKDNLKIKVFYFRCYLKIVKICSFLNLFAPVLLFLFGAKAKPLFVPQGTRGLLLIQTTST